MAKRLFPSFLSSAIITGGVLLASCGNPIVPPSRPPENIVRLDVQDAYTRLDSANQRLFSDTMPGDGYYWESGSAFKITFTPASETWDPAYLNNIVLFNIYRQYRGSTRPSLVQRSFGLRSGYGKGAAIVYRPSFGDPDTVIFDSVNYVYDVINNYNLAELQYAVSATVELEPGVSGANFSGGFENGLSYSGFKGGGYPTRFLIDSGKTSTPDREVTWGGQIDTSGLTKLIVIRYSEIATLDSAGVISDIAARFDSLHGAGSFPLGAGYTAEIQPDSTLLKRSTQGGLFKLGKIGRIDTVSRDNFASYFDTLIGDTGNSMVLLSRKDTLVDGLGRKWIAIKGVWDAAYRGNPWGFLSDDIAIRPYYPYLSLDRVGVRSREKSMGEDYQICVLDEDIPFEFNAFGDTTFSDTIQVWIATRGYTSSFFSVNGAILGMNLKSSPLLTKRIDSLVYDYLIESPARTFVLNQYKAAKGRLQVDFEKGYRVSPFTDLDGNNEFKTKGLALKTYTGDQLARTVRPGSMLGYEEGDTNRFLSHFPDVSAGWDTLTFFVDRGGKIVEDVFRTQGWHTAADDSRYAACMSRIQSAAAADTHWNVNACLRDFVPERFIAYDSSARYLNPFRSLPLNVPDARNGYKEFIILVYARGKHFHEPRVFISSNYSKYKFVWDKMPPQINWAEIYDPAINSWYAPMYYRDAANASRDKVTNLFLLNNVFRVCLSNLSTGDKETSLRDAGFGKIVSATLCFHHTEEPYEADPFTSLRTYSTPVKRFPILQDFLASQEQSVYGNNLGDNVKSHTSYAVGSVSFENIDARMWKSGIWDMWIETEDDLGNKGMAPYSGDYKKKTIDFREGFYFLRQIEIK